MKSFILFFIASFSMLENAHSQGCVAIRSTGGLCTMDMAGHKDTSAAHTANKWLFNANARYFNSFRHFVGSEEQKHRIAQGTQVINHNYSLDLSLTHLLNKRWSVSFNLPIISNTRTSLYEHGGKERHLTKSFGIGDARFSVNHWLLDPEKNRRFNVQVGLGLKLPTGDYKVLDRFNTTAGTKVLGPVDQSIQLGDGGTGFSTEINTFYNFSHRISLYGNFYYLINPREHNGVSTARGGTPSANAIAYGSDVMSVPDQYMIRFGANFTFNRLTLSAGLRDECLPARDLIGGSNGFRRPGYIISAEPGLTYAFKKINLYAYVPFALKRDRTQSVPDKIRTQITGVHAQGDAAFADLTVNMGMSIRF